jgi:cbb3-type cytochrome c oxidase subunit I
LHQDSFNFCPRLACILFAFGRLRPLHTSAVVFAFGGNALIATSFYVVQRTCRTRLALENLAWFVFWGYQIFIVLAASGYVLGITESREYAEPEWYVDFWLTIVWVAYFPVFFVMLLKRKEPQIYVANWFYLAFIFTIAMLHVVNNLAVPVSLLGSKSYSLFSGVRCFDPVVVWSQRCWLLPHCRLPRHDVLFCAKARWSPGLFIPAFDRSFLVHHIFIYLGRTASPSLHRTA